MVGGGGGGMGGEEKGKKRGEKEEDCRGIAHAQIFAETPSRK